jgi:alkanesulfonate monooxygenase SsuD/methylene tetrahydromethanopterin reductase-like flavin-dependent oxidoreductase (luciferase family)
VLAICAARLVAPFSRQAYAIDFYCLPDFLAANAERVRALVTATMERIGRDPARPRPCRVVHVGADEAKQRVFAELGFGRGVNLHAFPGDGDPQLAQVNEYEKNLG